MEHKQSFILPPSISSYMDIARLSRELEDINEQMLQLKLRQSGDQVKLPKTTMTLDKLVSSNNLNLLNEVDREALAKYVAAIKDNAPVIHISFSSDPTPIFLEKITTWLRKEIHPSLLLTVGLQPTIGAGCIVRTTNRYFDFSLSQNFLNKKQLLLNRLTAEPSPTGASS